MHDAHLLAAAAGVVLAYCMHKFPMRGDTTLFGECILCGLIFAIQVSSGAGILHAASLAFSLVACQFFALAAVAIAYRLSPLHPLYKFPGPILYKVTNLTLAHMVFSGKRWIVIKDLHAKYGKFVRTGPNTLSVSSAAAISPIYRSSTAFMRSNAYTRRSPGNGMFYLRARDEHNVRRKIWAPGFKPSAIASYAPLIEKKAQQMVEAMWRRREGPHGVVNMVEMVQHWSYDFMGELAYGHANRINMMANGDPDGIVANGAFLMSAFDTLGQAPALYDILWHIPTGNSMDVFEQLAEDSILARAKSKGQTADIASHLLGEHDPALPKLDGRDLILDSVLTIQAGSEATAAALTLLIFYLLSNPTSYTQLQSELDSAFDDPSAPLDTDTLHALPFLTAVVEESLRLSSLFGGLPRVVPKGGSHLDQVYVPEDTVVSVPPWTVHTDPENVWPEPERFIPERWLPDGLGPGSRLNKLAMLSFSHGPFSCIGRRIAHKELRVAAARLLLTYEMDLAPGFDGATFLSSIENMGITMFRYPLSVTFRKRCSPS